MVIEVIVQFMGDLLFKALDGLSSRGVESA